MRELDLTADLDTTPRVGDFGSGGEMKARQGKLPWFEIGGLTIDNLDVVFVDDDRGALAKPGIAGMIGSGILSRFDVIFDYPHERVGFVAHAASTSPGAK